MKDEVGGIPSVVECCAELPLLNNNAASASSFLSLKRTSRLHIHPHNTAISISIRTRRQNGDLLCVVYMPLHIVCVSAHPILSCHLTLDNFDPSSKLAGSRNLPSPSTKATIVEAIMADDRI